MTIKCPKCQHENPDNALYCGKCTTLLRHVEDISAAKTPETSAKGFPSKRKDFLPRRRDLLRERAKSS